jgi:hypothetical protein
MVSVGYRPSAAIAEPFPKQTVRLKVAGQVPEFSLTFADMPGVTRRYTSIQPLEEEVTLDSAVGFDSLYGDAL